MPFLRNKSDGQIMPVSTGFMTQGTPEGWEVFDMDAYMSIKHIEKTTTADTIEPQARKPGRPRKVDSITI